MKGLERVEDKLCMGKTVLKKSKSMATVLWQELQGHQKVLQTWRNEGDRMRKQQQKQLPCTGKLAYSVI